MDFDKDCHKPLDTFFSCQPKFDVSQSVEKQIIDLNKQIENQFGGWFWKDKIPNIFSFIESALKPSAMTDQWLDSIYKFYNTLIYKALKELESHALNNLNSVTIQYLDTINNPLHYQPIAILNNIPQIVKAYVMRKAAEQICYSITFQGHTGSVIQYDLHAASHRAITSSKDETFRLWDLETGKCIKVLDEKANFCPNGYHGYVKFNKEGSLLCTAIKLRTGEVQIKIWRLPSCEIIHTISYPYFITGVDFLKTSNLIVFSKYQQSIYDISGKEIILEKIIKGVFDPKWSYANSEGLSNPSFSPRMWSLNRTGLSIFHLCRRAIQNTESSNCLYKIILTTTYESLKENQKEVIDDDFQKKIMYFANKK